jgi:hypothetical protein
VVDQHRPTATDLRLREFAMADYAAVDELWRSAGLWMRPSGAKGALKAKLQILLGNDASATFFAARGYRLETDCVPWGKELVSGGAPDDWESS